MSACYIKKYSTEARNNDGQKVTAFVASCAKHAFQVVKVSRKARDRAADDHEREHLPLR